ncbi:MAG: TraR/DksA C4-type zinc finger protein [Thermoleophilia bacterium]|nr:TraR/DksA C4-type zinc finger protein [Thermoleophilia bacterium]
MAEIDTSLFRRRLLAERKRVEQALGHLHDENPSTITEGEEEETFDNHLGDAATITFNRELDHTLESNSGHVLAAIDEALKRIDEGSFGTCARCGKPIAAERLEAMPYATKCIECKRLEERA